MKNQWVLLSLGILGIVLGESVFSPETAQAGELCNYRNQLLQVSAAYLNKDNVWVAKGWWMVEPGECLTHPDDWYTYVQVNRDEVVARPQLKQEEAKTVQLCVTQDRYTSYNGVSWGPCDASDYGFSDNSMQTFYAIGPKREIIKED